MQGNITAGYNTVGYKTVLSAAHEHAYDTLHCSRAFRPVLAALELAALHTQRSKNSLDMLAEGGAVQVLQDLWWSPCTVKS